MGTRINDKEHRSNWFVGASYGERADDQTPRFLREGIWGKRI